MKILVACKRVIDYAVKIRVRAVGVEKANVRHSMNPFDEIALEEALRLKEKIEGVSEVIAVSHGPQECAETLRTALALGADSAIHFKTAPNHESQPLEVAKHLYLAIKKDPEIKLVIVGKQAIDDDLNQTGQILAGLLKWSQGTFISQVSADAKSATISREVDEGMQKIKIELPSVLTTDLRLNTPRYATLQNIMKAKKKPIETIPAESLPPQFQVVRVIEPKSKTPGKIVSVSEVVEVVQAL